MQSGQVEYMYIVRSSSWRCGPGDFTRVGGFGPRLLLDGLPAVWGRPPRVHQVAGVPVGFERLTSLGLRGNR